MSIDQMTEEERRAYEWALSQRHQSVAARTARTLAKFIERTLPKPQGDPNCPTCEGVGCHECSEEIYERGREALADERRDRARSYADGYEAGSNS